MNSPAQLGVNCKLTEGALNPLVQIIDKDINQICLVFYIISDQKFLLKYLLAKKDVGILKEVSSRNIVLPLFFFFFFKCLFLLCCRFT